jgi:hypothetical protein
VSSSLILGGGNVKLECRRKGTQLFCQMCWQVSGIN